MARLTEATRTKRENHWWRESKADVHSSVHEAMSALRDQHQARKTHIEECLKYYGVNVNREFVGNDLCIITDAIDSIPGGGLPLPINVIAMVADAFIAKVCRSQLKVMHVPVGVGLSNAKRQAEERTRFTDGIWYETQFREEAIQAAFDATVCSMGQIKVSPVHGKIEHEVVHPEELWWDEQDAKYGKPRTLAQRRAVDRDCLSALYPSKSRDIDEAGSSTEDDGYQRTSDQVLVTEAWHLPSAPSADDGRHIICVDTCTLLDEPCDAFPFAFLRWQPPARGFWQTGLVDDLVGIQIAINDLIIFVLESIGLMSSSKILVNNASGVNDSDFTDEIGKVIRYNGAVPPQYMIPNIVVPGEVYQQIELMQQRAFARAGLSQMSAASQTPAGLDASGRAIRVRSDVDTARHVLAGRAWERFHVSTSELDLQAGARLFEENPDFSTVHVGRKYGSFVAQSVAFKDVAPSDTKFVIRPYPAALLPEDPAGKLATLAEMEDRGYITPEQSIDMLDAPELETTIALKSAGLRVIDMAIDSILNDGAYLAPERYWPLAMCIDRAQARYCLAEQDLDVNDERLALLRAFIDEAFALVKAIQAENAPAPAPGPAPVPTQQGAPA